MQLYSYVLCVLLDDASIGCESFREVTDLFKII